MSDNLLRQTFVHDMRRLYPFLGELLDDELAYSLLSSGTGVTENDLARIVARLGHSMDQWQIKYLFDRLDVDLDGRVGFADYIVFLHDQDPTVAHKRGVTGRRAQNVATQNSHLNGDRPLRQSMPGEAIREEATPYRKKKAEVLLLAGRPATAEEKRCKFIGKCGGPHRP